MKNTTTLNFALSCATLAALAALTACGGGGGGGASDAPATPAAPDTSSTIVTTVPAATYSGEAQQAYNRLNSERAACGFGKLAQNAQLDQAAQAHADYQLIHNVVSHYEDAAAYPAGFTGATFENRLSAAGYPLLTGTGTETMYSDNFLNSYTGFGEKSARTLMALPYHLVGMMMPNNDVGVAVRSVASVTPTVVGGLQNSSVFNFGVKTGQVAQTMDATTVLTYPCQGVTGVDYRVRQESPNPVPGRDLATDPIGPGIAVMVRKGQTLVITSATMTNATTGAAIPLRAPISAVNDPNPGTLSGYGNYMGVLVPDEALAPNTSYQVSISGTNNGTAFTVPTFTFTTGTGG